MKLTVTQLLQRSGLFPRRQLRRGTNAHTEDGTEIRANASIELGSTPMRLRIAGAWYTCSAPPSPVMVLNKPTGVVCSTRADGGHTPVLQLVPEDVAGLPWLTIGRLDADTTGLIVFTCDGQLVQRMSHPKRAIPRDYLVATERALAERSRAAMLAGDVILNDGLVPMPTLVEPVSPAPTIPVDGAAQLQWTRVRLTEGKYHEVRRMFAAVGHPVIALHRERFGPVLLLQQAVADPAAAGVPEQADALFRMSVPSGTVARLTDDQVRSLYAELGMPAPDELLNVVAEANDDED